MRVELEHLEKAEVEASAAFPVAERVEVHVTDEFTDFCW
jgi:hypothetical protein